jgi:phosphopantothenoylcysteine decarboxylase/phosphopantothenate--cysteine ligase
MSNSNYLFFITGSIAAFKAAQVISRLVKEGHRVRCVATPSALKFVGAATFEGLTGEPVLSDLWEAGRAMDHIQLSRWADIGVVCPASANSIAQMALGLAPDVVSAALLAWPKGKPLHVFPAMNSEMLDAPATQGHLKTLSERGILVAATASGSLACGETGRGRLLEPDEIYTRIQRSAAPARKILITGGATREQIDGIRFISNVSTGQTAAQLCEHFSSEGWDVTYVHGAQAAKPSRKTRDLEFADVASLDDLLRRELSSFKYDAVIQAAAVSDYTVDRINGESRKTGGKISSAEALDLRLKPCAKVLPNLREYSSNKDIRVIGFKLLHNATLNELEAAADKVLRSGADAVVANDWAQLNADRGAHAGFLWTGLRQEFSGVPQMAQLISNFLSVKEGL